MNIYISDDCGVLVGPVELPEIPGLGKQMPSNSVALEAPLPEAAAGHEWVLVDGVVQQLVDNRGPIYSTATGAEETLDVLGAVPAGMTKMPKPSAAYVWSGSAWVKDCDYLHTVKTQEINRVCEAGITGGFWSSALGEPHLYASQIDDQLNLLGTVVSAQDSPFACRDNQGRKAFVPHSAAQIRQVGDDFTSYKLQLLQKANQLKQRLDESLADQDADALEALTWEDDQE